MCNFHFKNYWQCTHLVFISSGNLGIGLAIKKRTGLSRVSKLDLNHPTFLIGVSVDKIRCAPRKNVISMKEHAKQEILEVSIHLSDSASHREVDVRGSLHGLNSSESGSSLNLVTHSCENFSLNYTLSGNEQGSSTKTISPRAFCAW